MKVENILKKITPEMRKKELERIKSIELPKEYQKWVDEYKKAGGKRDDFTWKLFKKIIDESDYLNVPKKNQRSFHYVHFLFAMFVVLVDDIVDDNRDNQFLWRVFGILFEKGSMEKIHKNEWRYLKFIISVWDEIDTNIKTYSRYKKFIDLFKYDVKQIFNSIEYDYITNNRLYLINKAECWLYSPHSMQFVFNDDMYLMCSTNKSDKDIGELREIFWIAKKMVRIGNWVYTWKREVMEKDFSSGVFAYAKQKNVEIDRINKMKYNDIARRVRNSRAEKTLLNEWNDCYRQINKKNNFDLIKKYNLLKILRRLIVLEVISNIK